MGHTKSCHGKILTILGICLLRICPPSVDSNVAGEHGCTGEHGTQGAVGFSWGLVRVNPEIPERDFFHYTSGNKVIAGWKMDPKLRCNVFPIEDVDIPAIAM